jgi:hypothetical protein
MKSIKEILEPFILDDKNHLYSHNAEYLIKQLEENQREFGKELLEKAADNAKLLPFNGDYDVHEIDKYSITSVLDDYLLKNKI